MADSKKKYTTVSGDTFDIIAYKLFGNEKYAELLMEANFPLLDYIVFPSGIEMSIPEVEDKGVEVDLPEWRR